MCTEKKYRGDECVGKSGLRGGGSVRFKCGGQQCVHGWVWRCVEMCEWKEHMCRRGEEEVWVGKGGFQWLWL